MTDRSPSSPGSGQTPGAAEARVEWRGEYVDGHKGLIQRVVVYLTDAGVEIRTEGGGTVFWPYREIRQTRGFYAGDEVSLERGGDLPETLVVRDLGFVKRLHQIGRASGALAREPARRRGHVVRVTVALAVVLLVAAVGAWTGTALAGAVAMWVSVPWEERLGAAIVGELAPPGRRCSEPSRQKTIDDIVRALAVTPRSPYTFRVLVIDDPTVNVVGAPGGYVLLSSGLLARSRSAEELAGVLAHEMAHVALRHVTQGLFLQMPARLLLAALRDDVPGGTRAARALGSAPRDPRVEEQADIEAITRLLAARVDPAGMIAFLEALDDGSRSADAPGSAYLPVHSWTRDRIERLRTLAIERGRLAPPAVKLLEGYDWTDIGRICDSH